MFKRNDCKFNETYRTENFLRRCTRCILPETMPFIKFDDEGVCNYCHSYKKIRIKESKELETIVEKFKIRKGGSNCIVALSGGRDSCYGLHYIKRVIGLNPVAYTYDWGMVTDLAKRNQARICSKLGIEHIVVPADIKKKRANIRKNIEAWLRRPNLGMVPLFMAGDKQFFYYANRLKKQIGIELMIFCENKLERTDFKSGFCGINTLTNNTDRMHAVYIMSFANKIKIASYYIKQYLLNPAYINVSIADTLFAYASTYFLPHDYLLLYEYVPWDEEVIINTLRKEYDWEHADDTAATWRIGDGTAAFYNYIYYKIAGFSEHDTFLSNQIREGLIGRECALRQAVEANRPRFKSIKNYLDILNLDYCGVMKKINSISTLY